MIYVYLILWKKVQQKIVYEYICHTPWPRILDEQFKLCKDTFPLSMIVSFVDFTKKDKLKPQNEVQAMYDHSTQVSIFVHTTFIHVHDNKEEDSIFLRERHFYIKNVWTHSLEFVQGDFGLFYDNLRERDVRYNQHIIWKLHHKI